MNIKAMKLFLSEGSIGAHLEYFRRLRLIHSANEKCYPSAKCETAENVMKLQIKRAEKIRLISNMNELRLHECFFSSFVELPRQVREIKKYYTSEEAFCYELMEACMLTEYGFVYVALDNRRRPLIRTVEKYRELDLYAKPLLAIDVCEHAYFSDYGFDKKRYLRSLLSKIDLSRLYPACESK